MNASFVHLHLHTEYSLVDSVVRVKPLIKQTVAAGMPAVAVTDLGNLYAMIKFYKAALAAGVKPIIGAEVWVQRQQDAPARLVLLCQNLEGYRNLSVLISRSYLEGRQRDLPVVDGGWLHQHNAGLIALSAGRNGELGRLLLSGQMDQARRLLDHWRALFPDRFYLELQRTGRPNEAEYLEAALDLAGLTQTPVVATNDVRFLKRNEFEAHEARVCIQLGCVLDDPRRPREYSDQQYLRTPQEMATLFADLPEALENSVEIATRCNLQLELGKSVLPDFPLPPGMNTDTFFERESRAGLEMRLGQLFPGTLSLAERRPPYDQRLERELGVIKQMGFAGYFLIVADFIRWARDNGVPVGPGRGSGAGSLVAYALGITDLDPLAYDLLFERFLNPERVSMPDFDIDFCMEGRDRVIDYVAQRYGRERVSQIATHGTMAAKAVVRDAGRVLGHPYGFVDRIAKLIPFELGMTLDKALEQEDELRRLYEQDEEIKSLVDLARALEGLARNVGKHAGGVVIAPTQLTDFTPLYCEPDGTGVVAQFDKDDVEAIGLVKFDFLGLRTLTIIDWALQDVNRRRAARGEAALDINAISLADAAAFEQLKACHTTAVFQLESRGIRDLIRRLQPDRFDDIVALVALFRPGPLQSGMVDDFIDRKHGRATVAYPHPDLEPILKPTYGVILYQEQVMQIAQVLANYTLGGADLLRRAMGKKKPEEMAKQRTVFVAGASARGVADELSGYIFDLMEKFAGYGFNKSHSAAYALISYQTAWLKTHYPAAFMAAVLSSDMDKTDKVVIFIDECRRMKLALAPPSVNRSEYRFTTDEQGGILYGLGAIKGVGEGAVEAILEERRRGGLFQDLFDLCRRLDLRRVNRRVLESLIAAGACDGLGQHRASLSAQLDEALKLAEQNTRAGSAGQADLFGLPNEAMQSFGKPRAMAVREWDEAKRLEEEKKTLGFYLSGHPLARFEPELIHFTSGPLAEVTGGGGRYGRSADSAVTIAGLVTAVRTRNANRGGRMAFVTLEDRSGRAEIRLFPETYGKYRELIGEDRVLVVQGTLSFDDFSGSLRLTTERVLDLDSARAEHATRLLLQVEAEQLNDGLVGDLANALSPYRQGRCPVWVSYRRPGAHAQLVLDARWNIRPAEALLQRLRALLGADRVRLDYQRAGAGDHNPESFSQA